MKKYTVFTLCLGLMLLPAVLMAQQLEMPQPSPSASVEQKVGLIDAEVEYARPSMKGRKIFGDLVPYGEMWRTGANASTKVEFSGDVMINGQKLPAGEYALYTIPGKDEWTVIFHKNLTYWGVGGYKQEEDALRTTVKSVQIPMMVETFTIGFENLTDASADLTLTWENVKVAIPVTVNTDEVVMAQIDRVMKNPEASLANMYFQAANYYYTNEKDMNQALAWVNKAVELRDNAFWMMHLKAKILAKQGKKKEAKDAANKSINMAKAANNMDYVRLNEKLIQQENL